ncbi:MAG: tail fiber protein [Phycisphaerae bacterium]|nr:tail fiber protein [Phycisphaerae bacterium]
MEAFIGLIIPWPMNWAPQNWLPCDGRLLQIVNYQALFSLIWNQFGGDGRVTFALPDLRGRAPVGAGQGPGLDAVQLAQSSTQNAAGTDGLAQLGTNYVICVDGIYPQRDY